MRLDFTGFLYALSYALDAAEREVTHTTVEHGKRVAYLSYLMASREKLSDMELVDLTTCAILHDCAIAEYLREELEQESVSESEYKELREKYGTKSVHARLGEKKVAALPLHGNVENVILYHHENADGSGPFHIKEEETPFFSQLIHLADTIDMACDIPNLTQEEFIGVQETVKRLTGAMFSDEVASLFLANVTWEKIEELERRGPLELLKENIPSFVVDYTDAEMTRIAQFFTNIVDYKSSFTKDHSVGIAQKAQQLAQHYGFDHDKMVRFAFAGAMHDIGKMVVGNDILEKPDKLDDKEFKAMKNHAAETYKILSSIEGLEDIAEWAANHHEKLDGTGYSRRLTAEQQTFEDRLMACIDIYQALTEKRPYKDGLSHKKSIKIMTGMAEEGKIDADIVREMDLFFASDADSELEENELDENARLTTKVWKCPVCGYEYEGDTPPVTCPICDTDGEEFKLQ